MNFKKHIFICTNHRESNPEGSCAFHGGVELQAELKKRLKALGLSTEVRANKAGCLDACANGAVLVIYPQQIWYGRVKVSDLDEIIEKSLLKDEVIERLKIGT